MSDTPPQDPEPIEPEPQPPVGKVWTDEQLARKIVKENRKAEHELMRKLGFEDETGARRFLDEVKAREDAAKTETQRERESIEEMRKAVDAERETALTERHRARVERQLLKAGLAPEQLDRLSSVVRVEIGADDDEIAADIESLKAELPQLFSVTDAPTTPRPLDSYVPGKPPATRPLGDDPMTSGQKRAEAFGKRPGYNPLA